MSVLSHISLGFQKDELPDAIAFFERILMPLGAKTQLVIREGHKYGVADDETKPIVAVGFGKKKYYPEFWVQLPANGKPATAGNGTHIAFSFSNAEQVKEWYRLATESGDGNAAVGDGVPGPRPQYGPKYYAAFVNYKGHKLEAMWYDWRYTDFCNLL